MTKLKEEFFKILPPTILLFRALRMQLFADMLEPGSQPRLQRRIRTGCSTVIRYRICDSPETVSAGLPAVGTHRISGAQTGLRPAMRALRKSSVFGPTPLPTF